MRKTFALSLGFALVACGPSPDQVSLGSNTPGSSDPHLSCAPASVDFGPVEVGSCAARTVACSNASSSALTVLEVVVSRPELRVSSSAPITVQPRQGTEIQLELCPSNAGPVEGTLLIRHEDGLARELPVLGVGTISAGPPQIELVPATIDFGHLSPGAQSAPVAVLARNVGGSTLEVIRLIWGPGTSAILRAAGPNPRPTAIQLTIEPGQSAPLLELSFSAPTVPGNYGGQIAVLSNDPAQPSAVLSAAGVVDGAAAGLVLTPSQVSFGAVADGCSRRVAVTLANTASQSLPVETLTLSGDLSFSIVQPPNLPQVLAPGAALHFEIELTPMGGFDSHLSTLSVRSGGVVVLSAPLVGSLDRGQSWSFQQLAEPRADVLVVADNSGSMLPALDSLEGRIADFLAYASANDLDWKLGLTSAEAGEGLDGALVGAALDRQTSQPAGVWLNQVTALEQGTGSGIEQGLEASRLALALRNPGFLRGDASIGVIYVGDEDDQSASTVAFYVAALEALQPRLPVAVNAIVGMGPSACQGPTTSASPGVRYLDVVQRTGGSAASICDANTWSTALQFGPGFGLVHAFELVTNIAQPDRLTVSVSGVNVPALDPLDQSINWSFTGSTLRFELGRAPPAGAALVVSYAPVCTP